MNTGAPGNARPFVERPPLRGPLGRLFACLYGAAVARRNRAFDAGRGVVKLDRPVISIGNLSVGGTGKTPTVAHIAKMLLDAGRKPCIAMRGYASIAGESDEAAVYARELPEVPVVVDPNRADALVEFFATEKGESIDCVLLDDGFQHRRVSRDLDIVLIDATRSPFADRLLPAGWLREPVSSLSRAHAFLITHAETAGSDAVAALERQLRDGFPGRLVAQASHVWSGLRIAHDKSHKEREEPVEWLRGKRCAAVCAIGNPGPFLHQAELACGVGLTTALVLRDHDPYEAPTLQKVLRACGGVDALITTEKDWSKLRRVRPELWPCPVVRPKLQMRLHSGEDELRALVLAAASVSPD